MSSFLGTFGMVVAGQPVSVPASDPAITSVSTANWKDGATGVEINGTDFGASQGGGSVNISSQGVNEFETIGVAQTITAWTDTKITITVVIPTVSSIEQPGYYDVQVTHNGGAKSGTTQVLVGPNQTVAGTEHASGLALINNPTDTPQTIIAAETAGTFFHWTGVSIEKKVTWRANDQCIYAAGGGQDGSKEITEGSGGTWNTSGANWVEATQTQQDTDSGAFGSRTWDNSNSASAEFFIILSGQNQRNACRIRRSGDVTALAAADDSNTLSGSSDIETHFNSLLFKNDEVWITRTAHGLKGGECVKISGASAVGGITINGFYTVNTTEANRFLIEHESDATSAQTGGGASVVLVQGIGVYFDAANDDVYINIDPTVAAYRIYASTQTIAMQIDVGGLIMRGQDNDNKWDVFRYAALSNKGAIEHSRREGGATRDNNTWQFGGAHHCHSLGLNHRENGHKFLDMEYKYCGQNGFGGGSANTSSNNANNGIWRRHLVEYNNTSDSPDGVAGGFKITRTNSVNMDQMMILRNRNVGAWFDIHNSIGDVPNGVRRLHCYQNTNRGLFMEISDITVGTADSVFRNCLIQHNCAEANAGAYFGSHPSELDITDIHGDATHNCIFKESVIEVFDHPDVGPANAHKIQIDTRSVNTEYTVIKDNLFVYFGLVSGFPQSGLMNAGGTEANVALMHDNAVYSGNVYWHPGTSGSNIFTDAPFPGTHSSISETTWKGLGFDTDSEFHYAGSPPITTWKVGTMPNKTDGWDEDSIRGLSV